MNSKELWLSFKRRGRVVDYLFYAFKKQKEEAKLLKQKCSKEADKKANILTELCSKYDRVVFVDDDKKNVRAAKGLNLPNLKVIKAWEE